METEGPAVQVKVKQHKGYFARAFHGQERLGGLYWQYGFWTSFAASVFLNLGVSAPGIGSDGDIFDSLLIRPLFLLPTVVAWIACHIWFFKAIWNCAPNTEKEIWTDLARWSLILAVPAWLPFVLANVLWQGMFWLS